MKKEFATNAFAILQKLGQSLMIPVSVLPAAGLLVALGRFLQGYDQLVAVKVIGDICYGGGIAIFEQLPTLFAVGVAIGFSGGAAVTGLAAVAGYFTLINVLKAITVARDLPLPLNTGVFGGIMIGLLSAQVYKKFHDTKLPQFLGFFSGKRLVPIMTAALSLVLGLVLSVVWPPIQNGIHDFGVWIIGSDFGPPFYAAIKRMLIPVGLHHVFYPPILYEFGEFVSSSGEVLRGEAARYFGGDPNAGTFMASEYPMMMFGLPAASLAIYLRARPEKRKAIGGVMLAAALTVFITGISEPIEFAFIFVAPILFVFHIVLTFLTGQLSSMLDIHLGYTFSASLIDLFLGAFNQKNILLFIFVTGPVAALSYFLSFYYAIGWLNLKTPGREDEEEEIVLTGPEQNQDKATAVLAALGGSANIKHIDACITRLRLAVVDSNAVNTQKLKALGATGSLNAGGGNFQVIFGTQSDSLKEQIKLLMANPGLFVVNSPLKGTLVDLSLVPDEMFSQKLMGEGVAIDPTEGKVYAPCDGIVGTIFKTNHAVGIISDNGTEILIHVGIDTVKMNGEGFKGFVKDGDRVKKGQILIEFDLALIKAKAKSSITPIIITNSADLKSVTVEKNTGAISSLAPLIKVRS